MITLNSSIRDVYKTTIGKDVIDMALRGAGRGPGFLNSPLTGGLKLRSIDRLLGKRIPGLAETLVHLVNTENDAPPTPPHNIAHKWWKEAVVYQIYPRSFQDSNNDGIGDLAGIRQRIPYLKELGVDVVWLSPIYDSPNDDNGYDIRNYRKIMPEFGNMTSFNALLADLHKNGIKLMMDLVVNHTSDEHEWFQKALKDPTSPERDYYIWAKGKDGGEPNNWLSFFSGPAWNKYDNEDEWAMHLFSKKQMDLNWDNPALRAEIYDMVNWWLEKGVDGFRLDVINLISKGSMDDGNEYLGKTVGFRGIEHYFYGPRLHEYLKELREETFSKYDVFTVGETPGLGMEMSKMVSAEERAELDLVFNFDHLDNPGESRKTPYEFNARYFKSHFTKWQTEYGNNCWPCLFFENHDNPRMISKINPDPAWRVVISKMLAVLQFTQKGTPFLYQGQELGMTNSQFESISQLRDVEALNLYEELSQTMLPDPDRPGEDPAFNTVAWGTRDHARTPMQWNSTEHAGFTTATPWLGVNPNYPTINARLEMDNPGSVFRFYQKLIALRRGDDTLVYGEFHPVFMQNKHTLCFFRLGEHNKYYIEVNLTGDDQKRPGPLTSGHNLLAGNYGGVAGLLRPYEANIYRLK